MKQTLYLVLAFTAGQILQLLLNGFGSRIFPAYEFAVCLIMGGLVIVAVCAGLLLGTKIPASDPAACLEVFEDEDSAN